MLYGIPATKKGIDNGLNLIEMKDKNGQWLTPIAGELLTPKEKERIDKLNNKNKLKL
jgi:hypothetical protein